MMKMMIELYFAQKCHFDLSHEKSKEHYYPKQPKIRQKKKVLKQTNADNTLHAALRYPFEKQPAGPQQWADDK